RAAPCQEGVPGEKAVKRPPAVAAAPPRASDPPPGAATLPRRSRRGPGKPPGPRRVLPASPSPRPLPPMATTVTAQNSVDYAREIRVPAGEIAPRVTAALKAQRGRLNLKGFRPGRVPLSYVKKMLGSEVAAQVAEEVIGEAF